MSPEYEASAILLRRAALQHGLAGQAALEGEFVPRAKVFLAEAREILGVGPEATREEIQAAYGRLIRAVHPDAGGTSGLAARLNAARDTLLRK